MVYHQVFWSAPWFIGCIPCPISLSGQCMKNSRRQFMILSAAGTCTLALNGKVQAQAMVAETDPQAAALACMLDKKDRLAVFFISSHVLILKNSKWVLFMRQNLKYFLKHCAFFLGGDQPTVAWAERLRSLFGAFIGLMLVLTTAKYHWWTWRSRWMVDGILGRKRLIGICFASKPDGSALGCDRW